MNDVAARLADVRRRIAVACERAGREPSSVMLLAVSKFHEPSAIREAYAAGQKDFAENYVQELDEKAKAVADLPGVRFHFIGHLQRNKAKVLTRLGVAVQTVDSLRLAEALAKASTEERPTRVHVQVNVANEPQKSGCSLEELDALVHAVRAAPELELVGLMTIPPVADDPEETRPYFRTLAALAARHSLTEISMGMSDDFEIAIEEGSTCVRVGTAIFGDRA